MRKLNGIIFDKVAPNDPDFLWLNANGLFVCEGGQWINVYKSLVEDVSKLNNEIYSNVAVIDEDKPSVLIRLSDLESDVEALQEEVFPDNEEI